MAAYHLRTHDKGHRGNKILGATDACLLGLDPAHDHRRGPVPTGVVEALELAAAAPVDRMRGLHSCPWCPREGYQAMTYTTRSGEVLHLGGASVRVRGLGRDWLGPDLVLHYVDVHEYLPPAELIEDTAQRPLGGTS